MRFSSSALMMDGFNNIFKYIFIKNTVHMSVNVGYFSIHTYSSDLFCSITYYCDLQDIYCIFYSIICG